MTAPVQAALTGLLAAEPVTVAEAGTMIFVVFVVCGWLWLVGYDLRTSFAETDEQPRRRGDVRFADIAADPGFWLRRLKRRSGGRVHDIVYRAARDADVAELEAHTQLCRRIGELLDPAYALRLLETADETQWFWVSVYSETATRQHPHPAAAV